MKTADLFKRISAVAAAALALAGCSGLEVEVSEPIQPLILTIENQETKAILDSDANGYFAQWETNDRMGTVVVTGSSLTAGSSTITPGSPASVAVYNGYKKFKGGEEVYAYYPFSADTKTLSAKMSIPAEQSQSGLVFDFDAMPMVGGKYVIPDALDSMTYPVSGKLCMANLASVAEFRIYAGSSEFAGEKITSVSFSADAPIAGSFSVDLAGVNIYDPSTLVISGYTATAVNTSVANSPELQSADADAIKVYMILAPGTYGGTVSVSTDRAVYKFPLKSQQTFKRSSIRSLGVNLSTCKDIVPLSNEGAVTVSKTIYEMLDAQGQGSVSNGTVVSSLIMDEVITISTTGTGNSGKVYGTAPNRDWRLYTAGGGNIVISAASGFELREVTVTHEKTAASANDYTFGGPASGVPQAVSGSTVSFNMMSGNMKVTAVSVTYVPSSTPTPPTPPDPGPTGGTAYLGCYEIPALTVTGSSSGAETFGETSWYQFDLEQTALKVVTHTFAYDGRVVRNYTSCVHRDKRCAVWVAYAMHYGPYPNNGVGRGSFSVETSYDPAIPASWQSSGSTSDYNGGNGYARGHLCASADRLTTREANDQTFYYTNQAPQWQNSFNSGVWEQLESAVQNAMYSLGARDTLYVVSGTLFEDGNSGPSNDGGTVARPSHFYKLLMKCSFDSSGKMAAASGAAYLYENRAHTGTSYYDAVYQTTIDALELRAGFDFFAAVPASLQDSAESSFTNLFF